MIRLARPRPQFLGKGMTMQQFAELVCSSGKPVLPVVDVVVKNCPTCGQVVRDSGTRCP
jgi:predicted RNA-binding Zn-ribbon protein involved in translation (DUF1610 family)